MLVPNYPSSVQGSTKLVRSYHGSYRSCYGSLVQFRLVTVLCPSESLFVRFQGGMDENRTLYYVIIIAIT